MTLTFTNGQPIYSTKTTTIINVRCDPSTSGGTYTTVFDSTNFKFTVDFPTNVVCGLPPPRPSLPPQFHAVVSTRWGGADDDVRVSQFYYDYKGLRTASIELQKMWR